jgi:hypothetical protein
VIFALQFREKESSTAKLGFRIEAIKVSAMVLEFTINACVVTVVHDFVQSIFFSLQMAGESPICDLKKIKTREQVWCDDHSL